MTNALGITCDWKIHPQCFNHWITAYPPEGHTIENTRTEANEGEGWEVLKERGLYGGHDICYPCQIWKLEEEEAQAKSPETVST